MFNFSSFSAVRILCIGDVMLDRFVKGSVNRISPESPVPVLLVSNTQSIPGGAANVGRNVASLGGFCTLVGVIGDDVTGREMEAMLRDSSGKIQPRMVVTSSHPTIEKTRFVAHGQHLLRADAEDTVPYPQQVQNDLVAAIAAEIEAHDVLVLSDYAKGVLSDYVVKESIRLARASGKPVIVDPKSANLARYSGATVVTPNAKETQMATGVEPTTDEQAEVAGRVALEKAGIESVLITRAERGMSLVSRTQPVAHIPACAREVFDVVGAGDTVVATLALCLGADFSLQDAARLANSAAGIVVGKHGTATVTQSELLDELNQQQGGSNAPVKVLDLTLAKVRAANWQREGLKVGFTNGCFDIVHAGHIAILKFSRAHCDRLIVGLNSDASVKRLKGAQRPINSQDDRACVIAALEMVDAVVIFDQDTPAELIETLSPDLLVKGADYQIHQIVGADHVLSRGGEVLTCELVPGRSTTAIVNKFSNKDQ